MQGSFNYCPQSTFTGCLDIDDIGNTVIEGLDATSGSRQYLWIKTSHGQTKILEIGPFVPEGTDYTLQYFLIKFRVTYDRIEYKESKIEKAISKFLNNPTYNIFQANELDEEEFKEKINIDIFKFMEE